jgi:hypothetical protein
MNTIHRQFGEIIRDLQSNEANPNRKIVNWRKTARTAYVDKYMRLQDQNPNYTEHKIESKLIIFNKVLILFNSISGKRNFCTKRCLIEKSLCRWREKNLSE